MRVLIIEDELPAAKQLAKLVGTLCPACTILETLDSVEGAVRWLRNFPQPDLVFMDIQLADGLSFDIFNQVSITAPVIFTTAFDAYAIQAFKVNAVDYLLKPVDSNELKHALDRLPQRSGGVDMRILEQFFQKTNYKERFLIKSGQHIGFLQVSDIAFFRSSDGLTQAFTFEGKKHFIDHSIEELEQLLDPNVYFRISRQVTLRLQAIEKVAPHFNGRLKIEARPSPPEELFVSRERAPAFKTWLGGG